MQVFSDKFDEEDLDKLSEKIPECTGWCIPYQRRKQILEALGNNNISFNQEEADIKSLSTVHSPDYIRWLITAWTQGKESLDDDWFNEDMQTLSPSMHMTSLLPVYKHHYKACGFYTMDNTTPIFQHSFSHAAVSARTALLAAQFLLEHKTVSCVYALTTHPGHHAKTQAYEGYCFLNNAALAVNLLAHSGKKVAVLDLDVHAGNGTQEIFYSAPILTISIHSDPLIEYPHRESFASEKGTDEGKGFNCNLVFGKRPSKEIYLELVQQALDKLQHYQPDCLVIPFGADTFLKDPEVNTLAGASLEVKDYLELGSLIRKELVPTCQVLVTQEGGYCVEVVGQIVQNFLQGLCPIVS